jgi:hypothetical protein
MTRQQKFKEWVDNCSFREATLLVDLLVCGYILFMYIEAVLLASNEQLANISWVSALLGKVVIYSIVLMIASYIMLSLVSDKELEQPLDVREKQINLIGYKYSAWILQIGLAVGILQYQIEAYEIFASKINIPFLPLHIMVIAFMLAEIVNYLMQLIKGRTGEIYD